LTTLRADVRRAGKRYRCDDCGHPIRVGDLHIYLYGCGDDGDPMTAMRFCFHDLDWMYLTISRENMKLYRALEAHPDVEFDVVPDSLSRMCISNVRLREDD
jgi:hypothetical protein